LSLPFRVSGQNILCIPHFSLFSCVLHAPPISSSIDLMTLRLLSSILWNNLYDLKGKRRSLSSVGDVVVPYPTAVARYFLLIFFFPL
jgi:hypothetical protein